MSSTDESRDRRALIVIDVQRGFDAPAWGRRNNPSCEENVSALIEAWRSAGLPIVYVRHDSIEDGSPLGASAPGNAFKPEVSGEPDLLVSKRVHSAFLGSPDLHAWLQSHGVSGVAVSGIQTNFCCETTTRVASDLGYDTWFVLDATHTFDRLDPSGELVTADELMRITAANLDGEFARVLTTHEAVEAVAGR